MNSKFEYRFIFLQLLVLIFILSIWEWGWEFNQWLVEDYPRSVQKLFLITILDPFFISQPSEIWIRFQEMSCFITKSGQSTFFHQNEFWQCIDKNRYHLWGMTWATLYTTFWGFLVGVSSGVLVGLILGRSYVLAKIFEPFIVAFNSLPRIALVPLIVLLFGLGDLSKIMTAWIIVFFLVFFNTYEGARSVDRDQINAAKLMGASDLQITMTVVIPSTMSWVFASLTPAVSFSLIGVIVGEFIGADKGLGKIIIESESTMETADMMVSLFVLMIVGVLLAYFVRRIQSHLLRWQSQHSAER